MSRLSRIILGPERVLLLLVAGLGLILPSCDPNFTIPGLGYSTGGNFDKTKKTIRVPIFQNATYYRGVEFELTRDVIAEIQRRTHFKVVSPDVDADLELTGKIIAMAKNVTLSSPVNEVRNADVIMQVEVVLKDLRTGRILSRTPRRPGAVLPEEVPLVRDNPNLPGMNVAVPGPPAAPGAVNQDATMNAVPGVPGPDQMPGAPGLLVPPDEPLTPGQNGGFSIRATSSFIPEMSQSFTTAQQRCSLNMATQIVNMMEVGW